jgi:hypothetical protein
MKSEILGRPNRPLLFDTKRAAEENGVSSKSSTVAHVLVAEVTYSLSCCQYRTPMSLENKVLLYKAILKPIWAYGIELWGCAKPSNTKILQSFQSKTLRSITGAPYVMICIPNLVHIG